MEVLRPRVPATVYAIHLRRYPLLSLAAPGKKELTESYHLETEPSEGCGSRSPGSNPLLDSPASVETLDNTRRMKRRGYRYPFYSSVAWRLPANPSYQEEGHHRSHQHKNQKKKKKNKKKKKKKPTTCCSSPAHLMNLRTRIVTPSLWVIRWLFSLGHSHRCRSLML